MADEKRKRSLSPRSSARKETRVMSLKKSKLKHTTKIYNLHSNKNKVENQRRLNDKPSNTNGTHSSRKNCSRSMKGQRLNGSSGSEVGNFINLFSNLQTGRYKPSSFKKVGEDAVVKDLKCFGATLRQMVRDRQVSAITWHPTDPHLIACGGKAGTLTLYHTGKEYFMAPPAGEGGTVENIRFMTKSSPFEVCAASQDGTVSYYNFHSKTKTPLIVSNDESVWFCATDVHQDGKTVYGGDCLGNVAVHHLDSAKTDYRLQHLKLHAAKIRHLEFSSRDPNLMVTSSLDKTVKLWDVRKLNGSKSYIESLNHNYGVLAAKFSRTDGCRLLTTDTYSQLRVYKAPLWHLEHKITHPHRHHHITVIRASWHPRTDLFVVGRYPDTNLMSGPATPPGLCDIRSVDIFSASSGELCCELTDTSTNITSLAEFNATGTMLASSTGRQLHFWYSRGRQYSSSGIGRRDYYWSCVPRLIFHFLSSIQSRE